MAYGFSRLRWKGRDVVFYLVLATLMIPTWVTLVPLYILFNNLGWVNTYQPLIVPSFFGDPFSIFLLRQFFLRQPQELVGGGARRRRLARCASSLQIILPLARPALAVVALFAFIYSWTDFFNPLIYLSNPDNVHAAAGPVQLLRSQHFVDWPGFMAASLVVLAPIVDPVLPDAKDLYRGDHVHGPAWLAWIIDEQSEVWLLCWERGLPARSRMRAGSPRSQEATSSPAGCRLGYAGGIHRPSD